MVLRHLIAELRDNSGSETGGGLGYTLMLKGGDGTLERSTAPPRSVSIVQTVIAECADRIGTDIVAFINGVLAGTDDSNSELSPYVFRFPCILSFLGASFFLLSSYLAFFLITTCTHISADFFMHPKTHKYRHVHSLIFELWRIQCMREGIELMMTIIPRLSEQMDSPDLSSRLKAVTCLGKVFCAGHSTLISAHYSEFSCLLSKFCDMRPEVRTEICRIAGRLLLVLGQSVRYANWHKECADKLSKLLNDKDPSVRNTAVGVVGKMAYSENTIVYVPVSLMNTLVGRSKDRDPNVHHSASVSISKCFREHMVKSWPDNWDPTLGSTSFYAHIGKEISSKFASVPGALMDFYANAGGLSSVNMTNALAYTNSSSEPSISKSSAPQVSNAAPMIRLGFMSRVFDETLVSRRQLPQKRAQMIVAIYNEFTPGQKKGFAKMLKERGRLAEIVKCLMSNALKRGRAGLSKVNSDGIDNSADDKSVPRSSHEKSLRNILGQPLSELLMEILVKSHRDRNVFKMVKNLCDPQNNVRHAVDLRKRITSALKVAQSSDSASLMERGVQVLSALLQIVSLGGVASLATDSIIEVIHIARQCAQEGAMEKAIATTELIRHLVTMSPSYAYYSFSHLIDFFMEVSDPEAINDSDSSSSEELSDYDERDTLNGAIERNRQRRRPQFSEKDQLLEIILSIFTHTLTNVIEQNSEADCGAPEKQAKALKSKHVLKRLMSICTEGNKILVAEEAARVYGWMMLCTGASKRDWHKVIQEVRDCLNQSGSLTMSVNVDKAFSFPIAAAASLPVFLETAPMSGPDAMSRDIFSEICEEVQENVVARLEEQTSSFINSTETGSKKRRHSRSAQENRHGEYMFVGAMLLVRTLRVRLKYGFAERSGRERPSTILDGKNSAQHAKSAHSLLEIIYLILEDENMPLLAREGCMEAIFIFATGSKHGLEVLTPRTFYAIGHYMLSQKLDSSDRLSIVNRIHQLIVNPSAARKRIGILGYPMKFASLAVLCASSYCTYADGKVAEEKFMGLVAFLRQKMHHLVQKHGGQSEKRRRKITKLHLPERILQFGVAMIAHFSPGDETVGPAFDEKLRMCNFLLKPFMVENYNNYAIMVNMPNLIRTAHNVSDLHLQG